MTAGAAAVPTYASVWSRLAANLVDTLVLLPLLILLWLLPLPFLHGDVAQAVQFQAISIGYGGALLTWSGRTLGMRALNLRVAPVAPDATLTAGQAWLRTAAFSLPSAIPVVGTLVSLLDCAWMLWDRPHRQTLHDKLARTLVVSTLPPW